MHAHIVNCISAIHFSNNTKEYFFKEGDEVEIIESYYNFFEEHKDKTFIHWSMNSPSFGFNAINSRYKELTGIEVKHYPESNNDLSEYLKIKYGVDYISRKDGRLNNLAKLNYFSGYSEKIEIKTKFELSQRLELIFSIYQAEIQGKLKTINSLKYDNPYPDIFNFYGYQVFNDFKSMYNNQKLITPMSFLFSELQRDELINSNKSLKFFFNFCIEKYNMDFGKYEKFKSSYNRNEFIEKYRYILSKYNNHN